MIFIVISDGSCVRVEAARVFVPGFEWIRTLFLHNRFFARRIVEAWDLSELRTGRAVVGHHGLPLHEEGEEAIESARLFLLNQKMTPKKWRSVLGKSVRKAGGALNEELFLALLASDAEREARLLRR